MDGNMTLKSPMERTYPRPEQKETLIVVCI